MAAPVMRQSAAALLLALLLAAVCAGTDKCTARIMFASIPTRGHVTSLIGIAQELAARGCSVVFPFESSMIDWVNGSNFQTLPITSKMRVDDEATRAEREMTSKMKSPLDFLRQNFSGSVILSASDVYFDTFAPLWTADPSQKPDLMIIDMVTAAAMDLAEKFDVPFVVNVPGIYHNSYPGSFLTNLHTPQIFVGGSVHDQSLIARLKNLGSGLAALAIGQVFMSQFADKRAARGLPPRSFFDGIHAAHTPALFQTAIGYEYAQPIPPMHELVGPVFPFEDTEPLAADVERWLTELDDSPHGRRYGGAVYVSFGTMAVPSPEFLSAVNEALAQLPYKVVWSVPKAQHSDLPSRVADNVLVKSFVNQRALLKHANLRAFVTHAGGNGVIESLFAQVPMVTVPFSADQYSNAQRVVDCGAGLKLSKFELTAPLLRDALIEVIEKPQFKRAAHKVGVLLNAAGGRQRAADFVLRTLELGSDHLVPAFMRLPWYAAWNFDVWTTVLLALALALWLGFKFVFFAIRCVCCRRQKQNKSKTD